MHLICAKTRYQMGTSTNKQINKQMTIVQTSFHTLLFSSKGPYAQGGALGLALLPSSSSRSSCLGGCSDCCRSLGWLLNIVRRRVTVAIIGHNTMCALTWTAVSGPSQRDSPPCATSVVESCCLRASDVVSLQAWRCGCSSKKARFRHMRLDLP